MGYRIVYNGDVVIWKPERVRWGKVIGLTVLCFALFCLCTHCFWPEGAEVLEHWLYPGNVAVTRAALKNMAVNIRLGVDLEDTVTAFCREILNGAKISG